MKTVLLKYPKHGNNPPKIVESAPLHIRTSYTPLTQMTGPIQLDIGEHQISMSLQDAMWITEKLQAAIERVKAHEERV